MQQKFKAVICGTVISALVISVAQAESRDFDFDGFTQLSASTGVNVKITAGENYDIRVESDEKGFDELKITMNGDTLHVGRNKKNRMFKRQPTINAYVSVPELDGVSASSGADLRASGIDADRFSINVSSGAEVTVDGKCETLSAGASSGSELNGEGLRCENATVSASSGADATVYASQEVTANASSGSDITVLGGPKSRSVHESSGGDVSIRN